MNKKTDLISDIVAICNRHNIKSQQAVEVFTNRELMAEIIRTLEVFEGRGQ